MIGFSFNFLILVIASLLRNYDFRSGGTVGW